MVVAAAAAVMLALPDFSAPGTRVDESGEAVAESATAVTLLPLLLPPAQRLLPVVVVVEEVATVTVVSAVAVDADISEEVGRSPEATPASLRGAVVVAVGAEGKAGGGWDRCWPWPCRGRLSLEEATATAPAVKYYTTNTKHNKKKKRKNTYKYKGNKKKRSVRSITINAF